MAGLPSLDEQIDYYDQWNAQHRSGGFDEISPNIRACGAEVLRCIDALHLPAPSILEIGCGTGWLSQELAKRGKVKAIDLSPGAISKARERSAPVEFLSGDVLETDLGPERFDVVVCVETLFYIYDQAGLVEKIADVSTPGGYLILTVLNKFVYERRRSLRPPEPGQIRHWLSSSAVCDLLQARYRVQRRYTIEPAGDKGILRLVNSGKINRFLTLFVSQDKLRRAKESLGLGSHIVILAQRKQDVHQA